MELTPEERVEDLKHLVERMRNDDETPPSEFAAVCLDLGLLLCQYPDLGDAEPPLQEVSEKMEALWGWRHVDTQACVQALGSVLIGKDRHDEAEALFTRTYKGLRLSCGREHPWTLEAQNNLACFLLHKERREEAEQLFKASYISKLHVFGSKHVSTLRARCNIALIEHHGQDGELRTTLENLFQEMKDASGVRGSDKEKVGRQLITLCSRMDMQEEARAIREYLELSDGKLDKY